jgi:hypothetical protein
MNWKLSGHHRHGPHQEESRYKPRGDDCESWFVFVRGQRIYCDIQTGIFVNFDFNVHFLYLDLMFSLVLFSSLSFFCSRCPTLISVCGLVVEPNFIE